MFTGREAVRVLSAFLLPLIIVEKLWEKKKIKYFNQIYLFLQAWQGRTKTALSDTQQPRKIDRSVNLCPFSDRQHNFQPQQVAVCREKRGEDQKWS